LGFQGEIKTIERKGEVREGDRWTVYCTEISLPLPCVGAARDTRDLSRGNFRRKNAQMFVFMRERKEQTQK